MKKYGLILTFMFAFFFSVIGAGSVSADELSYDTTGDVSIASISDAEEIDIATSTNAEYKAVGGSIADPYHKVGIAEAFAANGLDIKTPLSTDSISTYEKGGIFVRASQNDLNAGRIAFIDSFNFNNNPVGRACIDAIAEPGITGSIDIYIDDEADPIASISIKNAKEKSDWGDDGFRLQNVYDKKLVGEHKVSIGFNITGGAEENTILLRSIEFAESSIPVVYFDIDESNVTIDDMLDNKTNRCTGSVSIKVPDGYVSEYTGSAESDYNNLKLEYVRGRGNSTWFADKKAFKFKLDKKQDLFGMGSNKHWVLLANRYDNSFTRNRLTYWLGNEYGMEFTPQCIPVEVVMNGRYFGIYLLAEQVRIGKSRVDIDELTDDDTDDPFITGGYLMGMNPYEDEPKESVFTTKHGMDFVNESPDFYEDGNTAQRDYIRNYMQKTEDAIYSKNFVDEAGISYKEYMDLDAAVKYWWVQEFTINGDAYQTPSTYLYKKRDGKLFWGPIWDFDYVAWGDLQYENMKTEGFGKMSSKWHNALKADKTFVDELKDKWPELDRILDEAIKPGGKLDTYYEEQHIAADYDREYWGLHESKTENYKEEIEQLRAWIKARKDWVNGNMDELNDLSKTITYMVDGEEYALDYYSNDEFVYEFIKGPKKDGKVFVGWCNAAGEKMSPDFYMKENLVLYAEYVDYEDATKAEKIYFIKNHITAMIGYGGIYPEHEVFPKKPDITECTWESSDESVVSIGDEGMLIPQSLGVATITATLKNGYSKTIEIKVVSSMTEVDRISSLKYENDLELYVGEYEQHMPSYEPKFNSAGFVYSIEDTSIATVDDYGVVQALKPGITTLKVSDYAESVVAECKVIVKEKKDKAVYTYTKGSNDSWKKGSSSGLLFTVEREGDNKGTFDHYRYAMVDGKRLGSKDATAESGSVNLTILPVFLEKLTAGKHTISLVFDDGSVESTFNIVDKDSDKEDPDDKKEDTPSDNGDKKGDTPSGNGANTPTKSSTTKNNNLKATSAKTGDSMPVVMVIIIMIVCMTFIVGYFIKKKHI